MMISVHRIGKIEAELSEVGPAVVTAKFIEPHVREPGSVSLDLFFQDHAIAKRYADAINAVTAELEAEFQQAAE